MVHLKSVKNYEVQEAMENFVFPDEIKTKMMKIDKIEMGEKGERNLKKIFLKGANFASNRASLANFHLTQL